MRLSRSKKILGALVFAALMVVSPLDVQVHAATPANYSKECQSWAHMISAGEDDPLMHMIGCDDGAEANGLYARSTGHCAAIARHMWRENHNLYLITLQVQYVDSTCVNFEDGSWSR
jgi:hypothetical protein